MSLNKSKLGKKRSPRFRRRADISFRLQDRDIEIIRQVYKHRFLSSKHIKALVSGSDQRILRRLFLLYHGKYLGRPREQLSPYKPGSRPLIYGLGNKGADLLSENFGIPRSKVDWTSKNRDVKTLFLQHTLMVADFMVCLELACREYGNIRIIEPQEILKGRPKGARKQVNPFKLKVQAVTRAYGNQGQVNIGVVPDKVFGLHFTEEPDGRNRAFFFLEADRATMTIVPNKFKLSKSSFYKKLLGYYLASPMKQNIFAKTFGFKNARVLTVTKSQDRIKSMIDANKKVDERRNGTGMFLFANSGIIDFNNPKRLLEKVWINGREEMTGLIY